MMDLHGAGHSGLCEVRAQPRRAGRGAVRPVSSAPGWPVCGSGVHEHLRRACLDDAGEHHDGAAEISADIFTAPIAAFAAANCP
jgi:hypothetical protein